MKKILFLLLLCSITAPASYAADNTPSDWFWNRKTVRASGRTATREIAAQPFSELTTSRQLTVTLVTGGDKIRIEADENHIEYVQVIQEHGLLEVTVKDDIRLSNPHIRVIVPTDGRIRRLSAMASSSIVGETPLTGDEVSLAAYSSGNIIAAVNAARCEVNAYSSGSIHVGIHADQCNIEASSSGQVQAAVVARTCKVTASSSAGIVLSGSADSCIADLNSSADLHAAKFIVKRYEITVSSSADADIHCTEHLTASASSSGSIDYQGSCTVTKDVSSSGSIDHHE